MFRTRATWVRSAKPLFNSKPRPFCTNNNNKTTKPTSDNSVSVSENDAVESNVSNDYHQAYKQLDKLDFVTAAKMLFTDPPKKKKFGFDFHLVQFFFACMPSLAVYLVAQYARYDIRKMEAELEQKKKQEEEKKAKEMELNATEEKEAGSDSELLEVKVRLDKLEEAIKEIVVETKKQPASGLAKNQKDGSEKKDLATEPTNTKSRSEPSNIVGKDHLNKQESVEPRPGS
ncbi:hypothetical protein CMV_008842 [Castanea mollissima]|uniref:Uncharacterized protein n=1 Tax=Castanea mollissima TaxID=60419 RepID=A0A8J4RL60_9ROSI|nr:hypothetical protein CMV_008842 [Castanea mollissima]